MLALTVVSMPLGNVILSMGMKKAGALYLWPLTALFATALRVFSLPTLWVGIALLISWFATYSLVLSWADYSFVQPVTSLGYAITALLGWLMLGEHIAPLEWLGIAVICLGVWVVGRTEAQTSTQTAKQASGHAEQPVSTRNPEEPV